MTATILKFPIERTAGNSGDVPSLEEMYRTLVSNFAVLDDVDRRFFALIHQVMLSGDKAKIDTLIECRSIAWTMISRHGLNQERGGKCHDKQ